MYEDRLLKIIFISDDKEVAMSMFNKYKEENNLEILEEKNHDNLSEILTTKSICYISCDAKQDWFIRQSDFIYTDEFLSDELIQKIGYARNTKVKSLSKTKLSDLF